MANENFGTLRIGRRRRRRVRRVNTSICMWRIFSVEVDGGPACRITMPGNQRHVIRSLAGVN